ncbi:MAG: sugar phosphate isomerase/epimerase [Planctomycetaceae bacterium]|jgi:L-ribulose-5-phosphate 3-epimerase|nr:sugar phosphate isomerase/epimerase [Planctomycetaceae bacterium]MDG2387724.1 sugar phosphate isomerase/epimerase [Planctomycetaceae bacterium]
MNDFLMPDRRLFLKSTAAAMLASHSLSAFGADDPGYPLKDRLYKTLKIGMVGVKGSLTDKFKAAKEAGFAAIEMNAPGMDVAETKQAILESGLPVDGTVNSTHWGTRHSDPDPEVRAKALESLKGAIRNTHAVGGHTVLLVVGHGKDGTEQEVWDRSVENIAKAIPVAAEYGVPIAFENVWNQFLYDHDGVADQTAEKWKKYVDEFNSPFVGMQFDIGNHWKYGSMGEWIRTLGKRIIKLDVKGFSREKGSFTKIGEGDLDFADVRKALTEINFYGYCAAEVGGGDAARLKEVSDNMDRVFNLV